ncbi:hypothetical protein ACHAXA_007998 [Cyclostephanos tholiformis]|uniref:Uncharacterized protein n=1 Tax=Cyclostephanos tholiformis TaxID=382380 RepID=A0ABD3R9S6_9STRA
MGFFQRISSSKNPQSASNSYSSSGSGGRGEGNSESQLSLDDDLVPTVNLTERRLRDWKNNNGLATTTVIGVDGSNDSGVSEPCSAGGVPGNIPLMGAYRGGGGGKGGNKSNIHVDFANPTPSPRNNSNNYASSSPNNLILLIERGKWAAATERARTHDHEVRQLVKLRKTTKNAPPMTSLSHNFGVMVVGAGATGAEGGGVDTDISISSSRGGGSTTGQRFMGSTGGLTSGKKNLQISNVKCKALHHACQKLRTVHTTIYQIRNVMAQTAISKNKDNNTRRLIIEEDEYIEACKCILALIKIHPEACRERESRHGCLPLHLCVFSMCETPPPPTPPTPPPSPLPQSLVDDLAAADNQGRDDIMNSMKMLPGSRSPSSSQKIKQFLSAGAVMSSPQSSPCLPLPTKPTVPKERQQGNGIPSHHSNHHRTIYSNSSADFSLGNISQMIQEESEHQRALTSHQQNTKVQGQQNITKHQQVNDARSDDGKSIDELEKIYKGMDDMEHLLMGLESKYEKEEDMDKAKKKKKTMSLSKKKNENGNDDNDNNNKSSLRKVEKRRDWTPKTSKSVSTTIINAVTTLDCLSERSRETDSHSTLRDSLDQDVAAMGGGSYGSKSSSLWSLSDERNNYDAVAVAAARHKSGTHFFKTTTPSYASSSRVMTNGCSRNKNAKNIDTNTTLTSSSPSLAISTNTSFPTHEDLQRRYLQINTARREEYSVRVINALLDAWPKSIKTSSEGGRLPLHMACFGKATVGVMETILKAYPDAARQRNHDGFLPVHIAAHWGVSHPDIAPLLLRAYPDGAVGRNRWERTPIEEALGMAGENGRKHQMSLVWSLRRHPTYWIHNDIGTMLQPQNVRMAPWRIVDADDSDLPSTNHNDGVSKDIGAGGISGSSGCGGAVDVDDVGSSDDEDEGVEVQMKMAQSQILNTHDPSYIRNLALSTDLSLLITRDKHWAAAALRCRSNPLEACEAMEVKVRGAYTAKITPLHYACENQPSVELIRALIQANPSALERRQEPGGQLPLHAACTWGASSYVIKVLLSALPSCAEMKDFLSNLPLHCACYSGADTMVVEALLHVYPQSVWPRNHQGSSAVDIVRRLNHRNRKEVLRILERTMSQLLEKSAAVEEEGVEMDQDNSLEWV